MSSPKICLRVKAPFACFTRPEFHVERVSYPVITPEAARGVLEAILMKPIEKPESGKRHNKVGFRWVVTRLGIVNKGTMFSILRNELGYDAHQVPEKAKGYEISSQRAQRHSLVLSGGSDENGGRKMLEYLIEAKIEVSIGRREDRRNSGGECLSQKYYQMFLRRAKKGQSFYQPFLGCREFSIAEWALEEHPPAKLNESVKEDFGMLFHKFDFSQVWNHWGNGRNAPRPQKGWNEQNHRPVPQFFHALAKYGWIEVPTREDKTC